MNLIGNHFQKHGYVHCFWIFVILSTVIAGLIIRSPDANKITDLINFAATITSLCVIAIFLSIVSNQGLAGSIETMTNSGSRLESIVNDVIAATAALESHSKAVADEAGRIPEYFGGLRDEISSKIDAFQSKTGAPSSDVDEQSSGDVLDGANSGSILSLYALALSKDKGKALDMNSLRPVSEYFSGILFGFISAIKLFKPRNIEIDLAGGSFNTRSLGSLDLVDVLAWKYPKQTLSIEKSKWAIDREFGLATDEDEPKGEDSQDEKQG